MRRCPPRPMIIGFQPRRRPMKNCPLCSREMPEQSRFCSVCEASLGEMTDDASSLLGRLAEEFTRAVRENRSPGVEEYARRYPQLAGQIRRLFPTIVVLEGAARGGISAGAETPTGDASGLPPLTSGGSERARFVSGTILSGRYRVVAMLGKGGMGEVYRAEDIKLGQEVALKFLPVLLAFDGGALARFHREVRVARQIAHPNVCRVFDIAEEGGQQFLSMEYIDGEDLASLLRRIGRVPKDKALDIGRQLCAGLSAAHESEVLHRDLKPANIMIDGRGRVKITDFGLAVLSDQRGEEVRAGTPAYMSPEQLIHGDFSSKSDIYALGLVLYEIFTGEKVYRAGSLAQLVKLHEDGHLVPPSSHVGDMDPKVDYWIMRCLEKNPRNRPSASEIAAVFAGGDALASALAAGETPSPEMVAASPGERAFRPGVAGLCLSAFLVCLLALVLLSGRGQLHRAVPMEIAPEALADRAGTFISKLHYSEPQVDTAYGFGVSDDSLRYLERVESPSDRWNRLSTGRPAVLYFWYRRSPSYLVPSNRRKVTPDNPPLDTPGMATVFFDTKGRLIEFRAVTGIGRSDDPQAATDWKALFDAAALDISAFRPVEAAWTVPVIHEERATWEGSLPDQPTTKIRVLAAASRGRPVFFRISGPWTAFPESREYVPAEGRAGFQRGAQSRAFFIFSFVVFIAATLTSTVLARRNLRIGRGDRQGAFRLALYVFISQMFAWAFQAHHVRMVAEMDLFYNALAWAMFYSGVSWVLYIALEPYIRRHQPYRIISWSRLLRGRFRDPLLGRDMLLGALLGTACVLLISSMYALAGRLGHSWDIPPSVALGTLTGIRGVIGQILAMQKEVLSDPLFLLVVLLLLTAVVRREWLACGIAWALFSVGAGRLMGVQSAAIWVVVAIVMATYLTLLVRFGLLATIVFQFFYFLLMNCPLTSDFFSWYASGTILVLLLAAALACYGYYVSLAGQPVFRGILRD